MDATWEFLRIFGGTTAEAMWNELTRLRRHEIEWQGVPNTFETFLACLEALQADGRASKSKEIWIPEFPAVAKVERREPQKERTLFV